MLVYVEGPTEPANGLFNSMRVVRQIHAIDHSMTSMIVVPRLVDAHTGMMRSMKLREQSR